MTEYKICRGQAFESKAVGRVAVGDYVVIPGRNDLFETNEVFESLNCRFFSVRLQNGHEALTCAFIGYEYVDKLGAPVKPLCFEIKTGDVIKHLGMWLTVLGITEGRVLKLRSRSGLVWTTEPFFATDDILVKPN